MTAIFDRRTIPDALRAKLWSWIGDDEVVKVYPYNDRDAYHVIKRDSQGRFDAIFAVKIDPPVRWTIRVVVQSGTPEDVFDALHRSALELMALAEATA